MKPRAVLGSSVVTTSPALGGINEGPISISTSSEPRRK